MTRSQLWSLNAALAILVIAAAWWAMNAPRVARPLAAPLGEVTLPTEKPPLPPGPFSRAPRDSADGVGRRDVFAARPADPRDGAPLRPEGPLARGVVPPGSAAPRRDLDNPPTLLNPGDDFAFGEGLPPPGHEQFYGGHLMTPDQRMSDIGGVVAIGEAGDAPIYAPKPTPHPRREAGAPTEDVAVETAAAGSTDGLILLGVFRSRGADRALVRTPDGGNVRVEQGDEIAGWRVYEIGDEFIELRSASRTRRLSLPD